MACPRQQPSLLTGLVSWWDGNSMDGSGNAAWQLPLTEEELDALFNTMKTPHQYPFHGVLPE